MVGLCLLDAPGAPGARLRSRRHRAGRPRPPFDRLGAQAFGPRRRPLLPLGPRARLFGTGGGEHRPAMPQRAPRRALCPVFAASCPRARNHPQGVRHRPGVPGPARGLPALTRSPICPVWAGAGAGGACWSEFRLVSLGLGSRPGGDALWCGPRAGPPYPLGGQPCGRTLGREVAGFLERRRRSALLASSSAATGGAKAATWSSRPFASSSVAARRAGLSSSAPNLRSRCPHQAS